MRCTLQRTLEFIVIRAWARSPIWTAVWRPQQRSLQRVGVSTASIWSGDTEWPVFSNINFLLMYLLVRISLSFFNGNERWRTQENSSCARRRPRIDQLPLCGSTSVGTLWMSWHTIHRSGITSLEGYMVFKVHCECSDFNSKIGTWNSVFCIERNEIS